MFPEWFKEAEQLFLQGYKYYQIAQKLKVDRKTVSKYIRKAGYESDQRYVRHFDYNKLRKYNLDETVFEVIDSEIKAYWLGFLYADGYVSDTGSKVELSLKEDDIKHLFKFKNFFNTDKKLYKKYKIINGKKYMGYRLEICSNKVHDDLIKLGCFPCKTKILEFPKKSILPKNLQRHFIRGYLDGDGYIGKGTTAYLTVEILGTEKFLKGIKSFCGYMKIKSYIYNFNHSSIKRIMLFSNNAERFLNKIYEDSNIFLNRKYEKYRVCRLETKLQKSQDD